MLFDYLNYTGLLYSSEVLFAGPDHLGKCGLWYVGPTHRKCTPAVVLTLNAPITTKVVCFSRLLKYLRSLYGKQCRPRTDCSYGSSLFLVNAVCSYTYFVSNVRQLFAADDFNRRHFSDAFFLGALRVNRML